LITPQGRIRGKTAEKSYSARGKKKKRQERELRAWEEDEHSKRETHFINTHTHRHNTAHTPPRKRSQGKTHTSYRVWTGENAREDTSMAGEGERETVVMPKSQWR
jgi:hypothetical protein